MGTQAGSEGGLAPSSSSPAFWLEYWSNPSDAKYVSLPVRPPRISDERVELRMPRKNRTSNRWLLLLLLYALAYPYGLELDVAARYMADTGMEKPAVRRAIHYIHHHYGALERLAPGYYRVRPEWMRLLEERMPGWRFMLIALAQRLGVKDERIKVIQLVISKPYLSALTMTLLAELQKDPKRYRELLLLLFNNDEKDKISYTNNTASPGVPVNLTGLAPRVEEMLRKEHESLVEELEEERGRDGVRMAVEALLALYASAREGKAYLAHRDRDGLAWRLRDAARRYLGESSSLARTEDPEVIRWVVARLAEAGLVFLKRYGRVNGVWKLRIDKAFQARLDALARG